MQLMSTYCRFAQRVAEEGKGKEEGRGFYHIFTIKFLFPETTGDEKESPCIVRSHFHLFSNP